MSSIFSRLRTKLHLTPTVARIIARLAIALFASLLLCYYLEFRLFQNNNTSTFNFVLERPLVFFWNSLLMFYIVLLFSGLFRGPFTGVGVTWIAIIILSYINARKLEFRGQPVLPEDFMLADQVGTLTKFVDVGSIFLVVIACILVLVVVFLLNRLTKTQLAWSKSNSSRWWHRSGRLVRLVFVLVAIFGFSAGTDFARNHSGERKEPIPWLHSQFEAWNQVVNYQNNGFILGFMYNWSKFDLTPPDGYSETKMAEIKTMAATANKQANQTQDLQKLADADYNIIVILNESFYDFGKISDHYQITKNPDHDIDESGDPAGDDVLPNWHALQTTTPHGWLYSLDYGGGTANIEFEAYTGLTNYWANTVPYVDLIPRVDRVPSIASYAKANGYDTVAVHPFNGGMYKRDFSLKKLGFDQFITEDEMDFTDKDSNRKYINDRSAYQQVIKELESHQTKTMVGLVTMQNHSGYGADNFAYHNYLVTNPDLDETERNALETYLQTAHLADKYLGEFLGELKSMNEKTVVLFYGDHAPGIISRVNDSGDKSVRDLGRETPYFIWANFDLPNPQFELPMTTPNCLSNTLYTTLGLRKPDYYQIVNQVCRETPILTQAYYGNEAPFYTTELSEYNLLTYDILGGAQYWLKSSTK